MDSKTEKPNSIADRFRLSIARMFPPATPRRGKRTTWNNDEETFLFQMAVASFLEQEMDEVVLLEEIKAAFKKGETRIFDIIAAAKTYADQIPHTSFSRKVMLTLRQKIHLTAKLGRAPTKAEVKASTGLDEEPQRWTEIFRAAGLANLPNGKPHAAKKAHGGRTRKR